MDRYALIKRVQNRAFGIINNVIVWDGSDRWTPPEDIELILVDDGWGFGVGDVYYFEDDFPFLAGEFHRPVPPDPDVDAEGYMVQNGVRLTDANGQWITAESYYA